MVKNPLIQSLRGLSVTLVVLFHIGIPVFRNGWVGVDIFFVISGFLMWKIYEGSILEGNISHFYSKRLQRLIPGLVVTLIISGIAFWFRSLPFERRDLVRELFGSITSTSNILYWSGDQYFSNGAFRPLLNMWSIACEIQFYLLFPLFIFWIRRDTKRFVLLLSASFLAAFTLNLLNAPSCFFLLPGRVWEFLIGGLAANYSGALFASKFNIRKPVILFLGATSLWLLAQGMSNLGQFCFRTLVVILTAQLLTFPVNQLPKFLVSRPLILIGNYSYSIYLVHFPLICFIGYKPFMGNIALVDDAFLIFLFIPILALASWFLKCFVEDSIFMRSNKIYIHLVGFALILILASSQPKIGNFGYTTAEVSVSNAMVDRDPFRCGFLLRMAFTNQPYKSCNISKRPVSAGKVLLVGNSHADSIKAAVAESIPDYDLYLLNENNSLRTDTLMTYIRGVQWINPKYVILHSSPGSTDLDTLEKFAQYLKSQNISLTVIAPIPQPPVNVPQYLYNHLGEDLSINFFTFPEFSIDSYLAQNKVELDSLKRLSSELNTRVIDTVDLYCLPLCQIVRKEGMKPLYFDTSHLTKTGASLLINRIQTSFDEGL